MFEPENVFKYHPPNDDQQRRYVEIRDSAKQLATRIMTDCPESREKSTALTNVQQAVMWANASIAINESDRPALTNPAPPAASAVENNPSKDPRWSFDDERKAAAEASDK